MYFIRGCGLAAYASAFTMSRLSHMSNCKVLRPLILPEERSTRFFCISRNVNTVQHLSPPKTFTVAKDNAEVEVSQSVDEILLGAVKLRTNVKEAAEFFTRLNKCLIGTDVPLQEIHKHPGFLNACNVVAKDCRYLKHYRLLSTLRALFHLKVPQDMYVVRALTNDVLWKARKMSIKNLVYLLSFLDVYENGEDRKNVTNETVVSLERRWVEIPSVDEVCSLLNLLGNFSSTFVHKLDIKMVEFVEKGCAEDFVKLFSALGKAKHRSTPVMRSLAFHIFRHVGQFNVKQIVAILYAMNVLNFPDDNLLNRLAIDLVPQVETIEKSATIAVVLMIMGQMRWKNKELLKAIAEWLKLRLDRCNAQHLAAYVLACGKLNYLRKENKTLLLKIRETLKTEKTEKQAVWLDIVWSFAVLQLADAELVKSVLKPEFQTWELTPIQKMKLWSIHNAAKFEVSGYDGPFLNLDSNEAITPTNQDEQALKKTIIDSLGNFLPLGKFLTVNKIRNGVVIDAEFVVDKNLRPLPIQDYDFDSSKPLPQGAERVALMIRNFKDLLLNNQSTGPTAFTKRILKHLGYYVVEIPHFEFPVQETILKKVQFLQQQIDNTLLHQKK